MKQSKIVKIIGKIFNYIATATLSLIVVLLVFIFITERTGAKVPTLGPYQMYIVLSDSMVPTFHAGDIVIIKNASAKDLKINDIITFVASGTKDTLVTHRIVGFEKTDNSLQYTTKGDNNSTKDGTVVKPDALKGKYLFNVPILGYFFVFLQKHPIIIMFAFLAIGLIFGINMIVSSLKEKKKIKEPLSKELSLESQTLLESKKIIL